jgi:tRNA(Ser,Leu) C12 N-acetylase TAN1
MELPDLRNLTLVTCTPGKESMCEVEVLDCLLPYDSSAYVKRTCFHGVILVDTNLEPNKVAELIANAEKAAIRDFIPFQTVVLSRTEDIVDAAVKVGSKYLKSNMSFMVRCQKRGRLVQSSTEIEKTVGDLLTRQTGSSVHFKDPDYIIRIEVVAGISGISIISAR